MLPAVNSILYAGAKFFRGDVERCGHRIQRHKLLRDKYCIY